MTSSPLTKARRTSNSIYGRVAGYRREDLPMAECCSIGHLKQLVESEGEKTLTQMLAGWDVPVPKGERVFGTSAAGG